MPAKEHLQEHFPEDFAPRRLIRHVTRASLSVPGEFAVVRRMPELAGLLLTL